jgi:UDP-N-acetylglucosamine 2-epimerase (non-hydrolysing)
MTMTPLRFTVPIGTRPEVIKLAGVVAALRDRGHEVRCVATGQHEDPRMYADVFAGLGLEPDAAWRLDGTEGDRVGGLLANAFLDLETFRPDAVLVLGDTYTAPLLSLAARRYGAGVIHLEAGLRSFNERSMEESNRRVVAALATLHLAPTRLAARFLRDEGVPAARIRVVGNPAIDALRATGVPRVPVTDRRGVLVTAHRATNVDDPERLRVLVDLVEDLGARHGPVVFPMHPRTRARLDEHGLLDRLATLPGVRCCEPLPFLDVLRELAASRVVVTDSGGLQEEASWFGVPTVIMRTTTPRWEGVELGAARLTGLDRERVRTAVAEFWPDEAQQRVAALPCPYGDGRTGQRVATLLMDSVVRSVLVPREPALGEIELPGPLEEGR